MILKSPKHTKTYLYSFWGLLLIMIASVVFLASGFWEGLIFFVVAYVLIRVKFYKQVAKCKDPLLMFFKKAHTYFKFYDLVFILGTVVCAIGIFFLDWIIIAVGAWMVLLWLVIMMVNVRFEKTGEKSEK